MTLHETPDITETKQEFRNGGFSPAPKETDMFTLIVLILSTTPDATVTEARRTYPFEGITACERALSSFKADAGAGMAVTAVCVPRVEK